MAAEATDNKILQLLLEMTKDSVEATDFDDKTLMMVRIAALVAVDAPAASYLLNLGVASEIGLNDDDVRDVLIAVAPIVGTPRVVSAATNIFAALGIAIELAALEESVKSQA